MIEKIQAIRSLVGGAITQKYSSDVIYHDGQTPPTQEQIQEKLAELQAAEPMRLLRLERNLKLVETDWVTIKAYSQGAEVSAEWKTYLQALRDLPATAEPKLDNVGNLTNVSWPEVPE